MNPVVLVEEDVSLIRWMLSLSPEERIQFAQKNAEAILKIRRVNNITGSKVEIQLEFEGFA